MREVECEDPTFLVKTECLCNPSLPQSCYEDDGKIYPWSWSLVEAPGRLCCIPNLLNFQHICIGNEVCSVCISFFSDHICMFYKLAR